MKSKLFVSFSGGETSGRMLIWILENWRDKYDEILVMFANTSQENEETLIFVDRVAKYANISVVWVEAVVHHGERRGCTHRVTNFKDAKRKGEVFEEVIKKYGIPNQAFPHCTRELKLNPMLSYIKALGWTNYDTAVGIRVDEIDRIAKSHRERRLIYPLIKDNPMTKKDINTFWDGMPFRLQLKGYQGNCKWCWKKTDRKHFTMIRENAENYKFPATMEQKYGTVGAGGESGIGRNSENLRVFFRQNRSTADMIELSAATVFEPVQDDAQVYNETLDIPSGCSDSCDAFAAT